MGLIHWWPLRGDLLDRAGTNNITGTNITFTTDGKLGQAVLFDSDNDILKVTNLAELSSLKTYSMGCWVYLTNTATNHSSAFLSSGEWNTKAEQVCFGVYSYSNGYSTLLVPNNVGWSTGINISSKKVGLNSWYHIAITYDGKTTNAYINGEYVGSYSGGGINSNSVGYYYLGGATYYAGFTMKGRMNDFRIYDHVLSPAEIHEWAKGLLVHYNFEDGVGSKVYDCSGYEYHATNTGVVEKTDSNIGKHSAYFATSGSQYLTIPNPPLDNKNISVSVWWKSSNKSAKGGYHILFATSYTSSVSSIEISIPSSGLLRWGFVIDSYRTTSNTTITPDLNNGQWRHIVMTYDGTTEKAYVDGVHVGSRTRSGSISYPANKDSYIGKYVGGSYGATDAYISDVKVYNTTLSAADVERLYKHTVKITPSQNIMANYLVENSEQIDFYDVNTWKVAGHGCRKQMVADGMELTALNGWESFAITTPSHMIGKKIVFSFDYKWTSDTRGNSGECSVWSKDSVYYYINNAALMVSDVSTLLTGQWAHVTAVIDSASTYTGFMNRGKDETGKVYGMVCRNFSLQLASESEVKIHPTGVVTTSRYGDSNKARIIKAGILTANEIVEN